MGGIKVKIPLEKKDSRAVGFSKRCKGLYSKASKLCLVSGGQIAHTMSKVLQDLKDLSFDAVEKRGDHEDVKKKKGVLHGTHQNQTLDLLQSSSSTICVHDDPTPNLEGFNKNTDEQILELSDNNSGLTVNLDGCNQEFGLYQILPISDNNNGNEGWCDQERDLDEFIDFEANCESLLMNLENMFDICMMKKTNQKNQCYYYETVEDGESVIHIDLGEDNLLFTDILNEFASIITPL